MATGDKLIKLDALKAVYDKQNGNIGPTEASSTASAAHAAGSYFIYGGVLYVATADIASGGTITPNTNCKAVTLGGDVSDLKSAIDELNTAVDIQDNTFSQLDTELITPNKYISKNGVETANNSYSYITINLVNNSDNKVYISGHFGHSKGNIPAVVCYNSSSSLLGNAYLPEQIETLTNYQVQLLDGTASIIVCYLNAYDFTVSYNSDNAIERLENSVEELQTELFGNKTYYVASNGNNSNDGSQAHPFATIAKALSVGATKIVVASGSYNEHLALNGKKDIEIVCYDPTPAVFTDATQAASTTFWVFNDCSNITINNISLSGGVLANFNFTGCKNIKLINCQANNAVNGMGIVSYSSSIECHHCIANNNAIDGFNIHNDNNSIYTYCEFHFCVANGNLDDGFSNHVNTNCLYNNCIASGNQNGFTIVGGNGSTLIDSCVSVDSIVIGNKGGNGIATDTASFNVLKVSNCYSNNNETNNYNIKATGNVYTFNNVTS